MNAEYVNHMGDDLMVVNAARVSFNKESKMETIYVDRDVQLYDEELCYYKPATISLGVGEQLKESDAKLIRYLSKNGHWTPFAHPQITLRMDAPVPIRTQCYKHKQGFVENEVSRRYTDEDVEFYMPDGWRGKPTNGAKQGSSEERITRIVFHGIAETWEADVDDLVSNHYATSLGLYQDMVAGGIAVEQARFVLPQAMMVKWYWTGSLAAFARFYRQRSDSHAQGEIQELAKMVDQIIRPLFPVSWQALSYVEEVEIV